MIAYLNLLIYLGSIWHLISDGPFLFPICPEVSVLPVPQLHTLVGVQFSRCREPCFMFDLLVS